MRRGLVIGKFMPIHQGHIALIQFAASQCEEVIVSMSYNDNDPIEGELRFSWIQEFFQSYSKIKPFIIRDDFDNESLPLPERTALWAEHMRKIYPPVNAIFSSEEYGAAFAQNMNAAHRSFDPDRKEFPVSATRIRQHPFRYWNFIPEIVRPYFVKKICFYGPESTGKSTMAKRMAEIYQTEFVPEVARELISSNEFTVKDILRIGYAQTKRVIDKTRIANKILFCDTDVITTEIYSQHYLKTVPEELYELENVIKYDQYFLFDIDVEWVQDGLRDLGERRVEMYQVFKNELDEREIPYLKISGSYAQRETYLRSVIDKILNSGSE
jgi:HTH-type transcriptional repressor of NAD biosynthesis genes